MPAFTAAPHCPRGKDEEVALACAEVSGSVARAGLDSPSFPQRPGERPDWEGYTPGAI